MYTALAGGRKAKQTVIKHFIGNTVSVDYK